MVNKLIVFLFPISLFSQVVKTEQGYLIQKSDMVILDQMARKSVECDRLVEDGLELVDQIRGAKMASDSIAGELYRAVWQLNDINVANNVVIAKLKVDNAALKLVLDEHRKALIREKRRFWGLAIGTAAITGLGSYLLLR